MRGWFKSTIFIAVLGACSQPTTPTHSDLLVDLSTTAISDAELEKITDKLSSEIGTILKRSQSLIAGAAPTCEDGSMQTYLFSLAAFGRALECQKLADSCLAKEDSGQLHFAAAVCANFLADISGAYSHYEAATSDQYRNDPDYLGRVYAFAKFAEDTQYSDKVEGILTKGFSGPLARQYTSARGLIEKITTGQSVLLDNREIDSFVNEILSGKDQLLASKVFLDAMNSSIRNDFRSRDALAQIVAHVSDPFFAAMSPLDLQFFFDAIRHAIYIQGSSGLTLATKLYTAYLPFAQPDISLPIEDNSFTYSQLASSTCRANLLDQASLPALVSMQTNWRSNAITTEAALASALALESQGHENSSDLLTFIGNLYDLREETEKARDYYWRAHQNCPYYNRAHWGLSSVNRRLRLQAYSDYASLKSEAAAVVGGLKVPAQFSTYVKNFGRLTSNAKSALTYSVSFWMPFIEGLSAQGKGIYVKSVFERLSDIAGFESLRDRRVETFDQRLYDDIRGIAMNDTIVADQGETSDVPFSAKLNTPVHEMAHQFHLSGPAQLQNCITALFGQAQRRNVFSVGYAATNEREYFAMGVQHYVIPENAPARFGINRGWYRENDPRLLGLIESIENSKGNLSAIACPAQIPPPEAVAKDIFLKVESNSNGEVTAYIGAPSQVDHVYLCMGPLKACVSSKAHRQTFATERTVQDRKIFRANGPLVVSDNLTVSLLGYDAQGKIQFQQAVQLRTP